MRIVTAALIPLALALGACATAYQDPYGPSGYPPVPYPEPYPPQGYPPPQDYPPPAYPAPAPADYRASGTEPFWDLAIGRDMIFTDRGTGLVVVEPTPQVIIGIAGEIYRTRRLDVNITHNDCSDGMSDRVYPDTVQVSVDGRQYRGCGGPGDSLAPLPPSPPVANGVAPPLDRTRWNVVAINGRPTPRQSEFTMAFDAGRLSARFGCNSIGAGFTQAGPTLNAGTLVATRMACPDMSWEAQGSAVLGRVMQVRALAPNRVTLTSSAGSIELARR